MSRLFLRFALPSALLAGSALLHAAPPREESPVPRDLINAVDAQSPDAESDALAAVAAANPLGSKENPVRVGGPEGERAYLARLRCADGKAPQIGARSEAGAGGFGSVVASFAVTCPGAAPQAVIMDMYHEEHDETRAPAGLTLSPR
ncbi:hypothetical protein [Allosphingosinicella indica]|uniref:Uncharacterized protein n=1 Tax=Allosphingosinicella indica TaxID=941907 RepID=A0A1X7FZG8_9SPHN|nr:hypothetical protein [Allosphingosinicella indica]SMF61492.1 hypothetical protein SAMN06295910_0482 [Allosphingosinicella indica]